MSHTMTLSTPLIAREQQESVNLREQRDSINNLLKWCRRATFVVFIFCLFLDTYVITALGDWYVSNHLGMRQDEAAMNMMSICVLFLYCAVPLIQAPPIILGVRLVILTFGRGSSVAKRWVVNALRDGNMNTEF